MRIIAHTSAEAQGLLQYFSEQEHQVSISATIIPSLIFTDIKPSLACVYLDRAACESGKAATVLQKVQASFKNCFCVIETTSISSQWLDTLWSLQPGNMRAYFVGSPQEAYLTIADVVARFGGSAEKSAMRCNYFKQEAESLVSVATARSIALEGLGRMGASERDALLVCESFCSVARIVAGPGAAVASDCPVEDDTLGHKMDAIFGV